MLGVLLRAIYNHIIIFIQLLLRGGEYPRRKHVRIGPLLVKEVLAEILSLFGLICLDLIGFRVYGAMGLGFMGFRA